MLTISKNLCLRKLPYCQSNIFLNLRDQSSLLDLKYEVESEWVTHF